MSIHYSISPASEIDAKSYDIFVLADGTDDRTLEMAKILNQKCADIQTIVLLKYQNNETLEEIKALFPSTQILPIMVKQSQTDFLRSLLDISDKLTSEKILIDISCIHTP